jgi:aldose sugar dehydrogenase
VRSIFLVDSNKSIKSLINAKTTHLILMSTYPGTKLLLFVCITFVWVSGSLELANMYRNSSAFGEISVEQPHSGPFLWDPKLKAETVFTGINFPTSMAFLGNDDILVLEKNEGTVKRIVNGTMLEDPLLKVNVSSTGERGMLGIAVVKRDNENKAPYVFLYFTAVTSKLNTFDGKADNNSTLITNRLVRYELSNDRLVNGKLIFEVDPKGQVIHNGGKMLVGPDNNVYLVIGDTNARNPQIEDFPNGRAGILRFTPEGDSVKNELGNSIMGNIHPLNKYYAYGIRNGFGMDFDPVSGILWDTENGPEFGDEINLVEPGFNSGWAAIQGFWTERYPVHEHFVLNPNPKDIANFGGRLTYSPPELAIHYPIGITALTFIKSINYGKQYENDILVGDFHNGNLYHFDLNTKRSAIELNGSLEDRIAKNSSELKGVIFGQGFGGITDIEIGPDGNIYILAVYQGGASCSPNKVAGCIEYSSSMPGTIFRIVSVNSSLVQKEQK